VRASIWLKSSPRRLTTRFTDHAPAFSPWVGFALAGGYVLAALVVGAVLMVRRDA
jgi:hypothetical protein